MGELIEFPGGKRIEPDAGSGGKADEPEFNAYIEPGIDEKKLGEMMDVLAGMIELQPGVLHNVGSREKLLGAGETPATDEDIIAIVNSSTPSDWQKHPAYYVAVFSELKRRGLLRY